MQVKANINKNQLKLSNDHVTRGQVANWGISGWLASAVGVRSRSELLDSTVGSNVFNAVSERCFVE